MKLWRHVHTRASKGELGSPGFQTVAHAEALGKAERQFLDQLAGQAIRCHAGTLVHSLLLQSFIDPTRCVLTRVEAMKESFDHRSEDHWVESQLVPTEWLRGLGWNLPAAFDAFDWWGAQRGPEEIERRGGAPALLPEESPPASQSPSRYRASRIVDLVPDPEIRCRILAAFARQATSIVQPGEPLFVGAVDMDGLAELRELLLLLPLAFPLGWRTRTDRESGHPRCLRLTTLGAPGHLPNQDLMGLKPSVLDQLRSQHEVFDLSGSVPPPRMAEGEPGEVARRIDQALCDGDGGRLAALHRELDPSQTSEERPTPMAFDDEPFDPNADLPPPWKGTPSDAKDRKERQWARREANEAAAGGAVREVLREKEELLDDLGEVVRRQKEHLHEEAGQLHDQLADTAVELQKRLEESARKLKSEQRSAFLDEEKELNDRIQNWIDQSKKDRQRLSEDLKQEHERALAALKERFEEASRALEESQTEKLNELSREAGLPPDEESDKAPLGGLLSRLRGRRALIALVVVLVIFALGAIGWIVFGFGEGGGPEQPPENTGKQKEADGDAPPGDSIPITAPVARQLLTAALASESSEIRNRAAQAWLLVTMDGDNARTLDADASCTLTQALVRERQIALGVVNTLAVDGGCGSDTKTAVGNVAGQECKSGNWPEQAACLWTRELTPGRAECEASWPLQLACEWHIESAEKFLTLLREAAALRQQTDLLESYDLMTNNELIEQLTALDDSDREDLTPLARLLVFAGEDGTTADGSWRMPNESERAKVEDHLNTLTTQESEDGDGNAAPEATET